MRLHNGKMQAQYSRTLSSREADILSELSYNGKIIFSNKDLKKYVDNPKSLIDGLSRKKWILKIKNGLYLIVPFEAGKLGSENYTIHSFVIASFLANPYYIGYVSALNFHGLTDKTPSSVYIATQESHRTRIILDTEFRFITVVPRKFFGIVETTVENRKVLVSSKEKTIVDCLDHPEYCEGIDEIARAIYFGERELDFTKLVSMSKEIGNSAVLKRIGYLSEHLKIEKLKDLMQSVSVSSGYSLLDPTIKSKGKIIEKWKIVINVNIDPEKWKQ
jgi:predicted transcriptional regulator of viral defense system